ncbi:hypothetical protein BCON_0198g00060 [Botryotinia convoluta]|uniref:Uncharacterized protein n=1 Tax=Botryotinia convoluta TaxID=54673 RepID=A0A4Z1HT14_9HELO|nr:hypothetical protein BCON_0198g00060 [Botryotinia convoluta]
MRPISLITAVILPLAFAAPVPDQNTTPQIIPIPSPAAIQALIDVGLGQFATPANIAYINGAIAAAEAAAAATQKAGGSSKRQTLGLGSLGDELGPLLNILGGLGLGLKERDEIVKRQLGLGDISNLGSVLGAPGPVLGPVTSIAGSLPIQAGTGILKRQSLPVVGNVVGSVPGVATGTGITNNLPIVGPAVGGILQNPTGVVTSVLGGGLKEKAKRRQEVAAAMKK